MNRFEHQGMMYGGPRGGEPRSEPKKKKSHACLGRDLTKPGPIESSFYRESTCGEPATIFYKQLSEHRWPKTFSKPDLPTKYLPICKYCDEYLKKHTIHLKSYYYKKPVSVAEYETYLVLNS